MQDYARNMKVRGARECAGEAADAVARIEDVIASRQRGETELPGLTFEQWTSLLRNPGAVADRRGTPQDDPGLAIPDEDLFRLADSLRNVLHPDRSVTYVVDRNINYSNICSCVCNFCAFSRRSGENGAYVLSQDQIFAKVEETLELGGSGILLQGGLHPELPLQWYTDLLRNLKQRYGIYIHAFSPPEIYGMSEVSGRTPREVLLELKDAGLDSLPGGGAEILVDEVRRKRRSKVSSSQWLDIMEIAHGLSLPTTATMMFGHGESALHRLQHLEKIRALQDRTGGVVAFIPWNFQPDNTPLGRRYPHRVQAQEYLRWLAVSRLYLVNVPNIQVSWLTQGLDVGRWGLHAGANDLGSTMIEENVIRPAGARHQATEDMLRQVISLEGYTPVVRNAAYVRLLDRRGSGRWSL